MNESLPCKRQAFRVLYSGRVQGVGFRAVAARMARTFSLVGWVRNRADGCVEMVVEGDPLRLQSYLESLAAYWNGSILKEEKEASEATGQYQTFEVVR